jgi:hypothetical protein
MPNIVSIKEYEKSEPLLLSSFERQLILKDCVSKLSLTRPLDGDGY